MEVAPAVRRHLLNQAAIRGYVDDRVYTHKLREHVHGTGQRAIVVRTGGGWSQPDEINTGEFPLLYVDCWADRSRGDDGSARGQDEVTNVWAMWRPIDPLLHGKRGVRWGVFGSDPGLMVVSSARWSEPIVQTRDESHGGVAYGVELGDCAVLTVAYALTVIH